MSDRILITGGAGFLGRHLAARFAAREREVTVFDDLSARGSTFEHSELRAPNISCILGSTNDVPCIRALVEEHRYIVHFASVVGVEQTMQEPLATVENLVGTLEIARALTPEHSVLFGSSADVYGLHSNLYGRPMREEDHSVFESAEVARWTYARVKGLEEHLLLRSPARVGVARIFNAYGPKMDAGDPRRLVPQLVQALLRGEALRVSGNGDQVRSMCFVDDTVRGLHSLLDHVAVRDAPYRVIVNLGSDRSHAVREIVNRTVTAALETGIIREPPPIIKDARLYSHAFDDGWHRVPDTGRARSLLGFECQVSLDEGLRRTLLVERDSRSES